MCAARPVVATGVGGLGEGGSKLVALDKKDEKGEEVEELASRFADELWPLLTEPSLARKAGCMAREHVVGHFDLEQVYVKPMLAEYRRLLGPDPDAYECDIPQPSGSPETLDTPSLSTSTVTD